MQHATHSTHTRLAASRTILIVGRDTNLAQRTFRHWRIRLSTPQVRSVMANGTLARVCAYALAAVLARRIAEGLRTGSRGRRVVLVQFHLVGQVTFPYALFEDRRVHLGCN